jgi:Flp pilus assembly protein TadG
MRSMKRGQRGAALIETALAVPVILVALYGVSYGIRVAAVSEHAESAVRYAGVVSAQQNPYHDYSLYALYNNLGTTSNVETNACAQPTSLFLSGGALPVVVPGTQQKQEIVPSFWQPDSAPRPFCDATPERQYFTGATRSYLLLQSVPGIDTVVSDGGYFGTTLFGSAGQTKYKFYRSPDMATLMHCAATLSSSISSSLAPLKYGSAARPLVALQASDFNSAPLGLSPNCAAIGTQPIVPTPAPQSFVPGTVPSATPGPGASPTTPPTPNPTATAATPKPSASPSAAASPTPKASPTGGGGGSGGGGGGNPTPSPSPGGKGGSPAPVGSPSGTPTGKPTSIPATPSPSKSPSTPKPTTKPTTSPSATPAPTAKPSAPPGNYS